MVDLMSVQPTDAHRDFTESLKQTIRQHMNDLTAVEILALMAQFCGRSMAYFRQDMMEMFLANLVNSYESTIRDEHGGLN